MKKTKTIGTIAALLVLLMSGCGGNHSSTSPDDSSGAQSSVAASSVVVGSSATVTSSSSVQATAKIPIKLVQFTGGLAKTGLAKTGFIDSMNINLGKIKATKTFPFLLLNNSSTEITNITLVSNNPAFEVYPSTISVLGAPDSSVSSMPMIQVTAVHGLASSGTGFKAPVMRDTNSTAAITISGDYAGSTFSVTYNMAVTPLYVSWQKFKLMYYLVGTTWTVDSTLGTDLAAYPGTTMTTDQGVAAYCGVLASTSDGCTIKGINSLAAGGANNTKVSYAAGDTVRFHAIESDCVFDETQIFEPRDQQSAETKYNISCDALGDSIILSDPADTLYPKTLTGQTMN